MIKKKRFNISEQYWNDFSEKVYLPFYQLITLLMYNAVLRTILIETAIELKNRNKIL